MGAPCLTMRSRAFMKIGGQELILILLLVLVFFGARKLPELARGMGHAVKEFQKAKDQFNAELHAPGKPEVDPTPSAMPRSPAEDDSVRSSEKAVARPRGHDV